MRHFQSSAKEVFLICFGRQRRFQKWPGLLSNTTANVGRKRRMVRDLFSETLQKDASTFASVQDITILAAPDTCESCMAWPLIPPVTNAAPMKGKAKSGGVHPPVWYVAAQPRQGRSLPPPQNDHLVRAIAKERRAFPSSGGLPKHPAPAPRPAEPATPGGEPVVHMVVCALDYKGTKHPPACTTDGENMVHLVNSC